MKASLQVQAQTTDDALTSLLIPPIPLVHTRMNGQAGPLDFTVEAGNGPETATFSVSIEDVPDSDAASDANHRTVADAVAVYKLNRDHPRTHRAPSKSTLKPSREHKATSRRGRGTYP